jgi:hypothetical protein
MFSFYTVIKDCYFFNSTILVFGTHVSLPYYLQEKPSSYMVEMARVESVSPHTELPHFESFLVL